ncbi:MAG: GAF domain-containing protein [Xanthomonadales bacterium]|nr:GAF domain-containing protein [Xanthomonadales bacterium]
MNADFRERDRLDALRQMVEDVSSELELQPLLTRLIESACRLIGADDGTIGLYVPERNVIRTAAAYRMPAGEIGAEMGPNIGLAGRVLASGEAVIARYGDLANITLLELAENRVVGLPIRWRGRLIGFFGIGASPPHVFAGSDIALLEVFARHAAIAIDNARRYDEERRRAARFALIARVTAALGASSDVDVVLQRVADAVHELLGFENIDIPLLDADDPTVLVIRIRGGHYKDRIQHEDRIPIAHGIMGAAVREGRTQCVNDVRNDPRYITPPEVPVPQAELAIPIVLGGEVLGVLNVESNRLFDALDIASLDIVASHLAVAIENARLLAEARDVAVLAERQRLARELHDNVTQILSSINLITQTLPQALRKDSAEAERRALRLHELAQSGFAELRALLRELTPPKHANRPTISRAGRAFLGLEKLREGGLPAALTPLLKRMLPESIRLVLNIGSYELQRLDREEALFRVCQEAVSNAVRHAQATRLTIGLKLSERALTLSVLDNGRGIAADRRDGLGLGHMRERVEQLGGVFRIVPAAPQGTLIEAAVPREDRNPP